MSFASIWITAYQSYFLNKLVLQLTCAGSLAFVLKMHKVNNAQYQTHNTCASTGLTHQVKMVCSFTAESILLNLQKVDPPHRIANRNRRFIRANRTSSHCCISHKTC